MTGFSNFVNTSTSFVMFVGSNAMVRGQVCSNYYSHAFRGAAGQGRTRVGSDLGGSVAQRSMTDIYWPTTVWWVMSGITVGLLIWHHGITLGYIWWVSWAIR